MVSGLFAVKFWKGICLGTSGFECSFGVWLVMGAIFLATAMFRRLVANELLNMPFSLIGAAIASELAYAITFIVSGHNYKISVVIALAFMIAAGFLIGDKFGEGESEGESSVGSYEEA